MSKADDLKALIDKLEKLDHDAGVYLIRVDGTPSTMEQYIEDDADIIAKACAVVVPYPSPIGVPAPGAVG